MATDCNSLLTGDILYDCNTPAQPGIEVDVLLVNRADIDITSTVVSPTNKILITNFNLKTGKTGFLVKGVKQIFAASQELVKKEIGADKWKHTFTGAILNISAENKLRLQELSEGTNLVAIIETKFKGEDKADAFHVLGFEQGLELTTSTWSTTENEGTMQFTLESVDGYEEPTVIQTLLETDYATTKAAFDNKFAAA